jgi:hypothetical protein
LSQYCDISREETVMTFILKDEWDEIKRKKQPADLWWE